MKQNTDQLSTGVAYSYIEYINAYLNLLNNSLYFSVEYLDEETFVIQQELKNIFLSLPQLLSSGNTDREDYAHKLLEFRPILEQKYRILNAYQRELNHFLTIKQNKEALTDSYLESVGLSDEDIHTIDFNHLATDCTNFVFSNKSEEIRQQHAAQLFPYIPIKITKDNYLSYVQKSIQHIAIEDTVESAHFLTSILMQLFDGKSCPEYGQHFKDLLVTFEELRQIEDAEDFFEEADLLQETLTTLLNLLHSMFDMLCTLSNLLLFDQLDFTDLTNLHVSFFDLYHSVKAILNHESDAQIFSSTLIERIEGVQTELKEDMRKVSQSSEIDPLFTLIQTYLSMDLGQLFGFAVQKETHYSPEVLSIFNAFINDLREKLLSLPTAERKLRMQYFISNIPFVMSQKTLQLYIEQAFKNMAQPRRGLLAAMQLHSILDQENYFGLELSDEDQELLSHEEDFETFASTLSIHDHYPEDAICHDDHCDCHNDNDSNEHCECDGDHDCHCHE